MIYLSTRRNYAGSIELIDSAKPGTMEKKLKQPERGALTGVIRLLIHDLPTDTQKKPEK